MIPKIIWTYWDTPEIPQYIQDCLNTWKKHCRNNWSINILNCNTIKLFLEENIDYPDHIWKDKPQHQSDMFSVALIKKYGGIWMDANIIMQHSIDFIVEKDWFGYCNNTNFEIFLFASTKNSYAITTIHTLFFKIFSLSNIERTHILEHTYNISDSYLYPQQLITYLYNNNKQIKLTIDNNSINQWESIYILIMYLSKIYKVQTKNKIFKTLLNLNDSIPDIILKEPLLKLQGSAQQGEYFIDTQCWWYSLVN